MADTDPALSNQTTDDPNSLETLESQENTLEDSPSSQTAAAPENTPAGEGTPPPPQRDNLLKQLLKGFRERLNIYLLLLGLVMLIAGVVILIAYLQTRQAPATAHLQTQGLSQSTLDQLANSDATVGSSQSVLNVESSAVFAGQVLIRQNLEVAGNLQIGGTVALSDISVAGTSQLGQVTVSKNLAVTGDTAIQGAVTISKSLQVNGGGTFSGALSAPQITTSNLQLSGNLVLTHHITIGGSTPSRSSGPALGGGGSVSVGGADTAGSVSVNTGSSPAAGCFVTVNFTTAYNSTPHVLVTPIGSAAASVNYYVNRSTTNFSICAATAAPANSSFGFDYFIVD